MEKISGIIKSSPRVQSVDLKESNPVRPGTPSFGRPEGVSSLSKSVNELETGKRALTEAEAQAGWRMKDQKHAALVADLNDKFFVKPSMDDSASTVKMSSALPEMSTAAALSLRDRASNPAGFKNDEIGSMKTASNLRSRMPSFEMDDEPAMMAQPEGLFPKGSFIDRTA